MKRFVLVAFVVALLSGCASTPQVVTPMPPTQENVNALKSDYRKTVEVLLVSCIERETNSYIANSSGFGDHRKANNPNRNQYRSVVETISVVETTKTGERFEMYGCFGKSGDRFRISY